MVDAWSRECWDMLWSTSTGDARDAAGGVRGRPPSLVRHDTAAQDHCDGGCRALHLPLFTKALHTTWVRRVIDPAPQPWKNLFGFLVLKGHQLSAGVVSTCCAPRLTSATLRATCRRCLRQQFAPGGRCLHRCLSGTLYLLLRMEQR